MHKFSRVQHIFHRGEKNVSVQQKGACKFWRCKLRFDLARVQEKKMQGPVDQGVRYGGVS